MGTRDERLDEAAQAGGVGTITRPGAPPRLPPRRAGRRTGAPRLPGAPGQPGQAAQPSKAAQPGKAGPVGQPGRAQAARHAQRMPFFLLLCCLLGGALICALVITTTLAEGSFQITRLQQADNALSRQQQLLLEQVAAAQSAQVIEARALQLGMRPAGELRFINLKTGKIQTDAGSGAVAAINVPGYTP